MQLAKYISAIRARFPGVVVALVEPLPWFSLKYNETIVYPQVPGGNHYGEYTRLMTQVHKGVLNAGSHLDEIVADSPYNFNLKTPAPEGEHDDNKWGWRKLAAASSFVRDKLGLKFSHYFNDAEGGATSNALFASNTHKEFENCKDAGVVVSEASVRSWYLYPDTFVPETSAGTFTNLMLSLMGRED